MIPRIDWKRGAVAGIGLGAIVRSMLCIPTIWLILHIVTAVVWDGWTHWHEGLWK